tara:strand:- start:2666 stop:2941 length:276 start_codon:yes stop_codon:yes gene_type:complete
MPYKLVPTQYERVEMTESERIRKNQQTKKYREKMKQQDPELFKEKDRIRNRQYYQRKKDRKVSELAAEQAAKNLKNDEVGDSKMVEENTNM